MTQYLVSFDDGTMTIADEDLGTVSDDAHAVAKEAHDAGFCIIGGCVILGVPRATRHFAGPRRSQLPVAPRKGSAKPCSTRSSD